MMDELRMSNGWMSHHESAEETLLAGNLKGTGSNHRDSRLDWPLKLPVDDNKKTIA